MVGVLTLSGSGTAVMRAAAQGRRAAWPLFRARLPFCLAGSAVLLVAAAVFAATGRGPTAAALTAAAVWLPLYLGADVYPQELLGERRYSRYLVFQIVLQTATALAVIAALLVARHRPWLAVAAFTGATGVIQLAGLLSVRRGARVDAVDRTYAGRMTAITVLAAIDPRLDILLTGLLLGARDAGLVAVARTFPGLLKTLWTVLYRPFFVRMSAGSLEEGRALVRRYRVALAACFALATGIGIALAPFLIRVLFGARFESSATLTRLLLAGAFLSSLGFLELTLIRAQGDLRREGIVYIVLPIVSLVALPPLILVFGIDGVGIEAVAAGAVYWLLVRFLSPRISPQLTAG
jgi:O-antigen/teichoic acid export membrane protein